MERYDLICPKGADFRKRLRLKQNGVYLDLTGWSAKSQVRVEPDGGELICIIDTEVSNDGSEVVMTLSDSVTAELPAGTYVWDIKLTDTDDITRYYLGGAFRVVPTVTD